jgi:hypothetical protein
MAGPKLIAHIQHQTAFAREPLALFQEIRCRVLRKARPRRTT